MIRDHIKKAAGDQVIVLVQGVITSVDKETDTCEVTPVDDGSAYIGVKLEAIDNSEAGRSDIVRYPALGAYAIIGILDNDRTNSFLVTASKYESIIITIAQSAKITVSGNGVVTVDAATITFNGGNNKGLVNIKPLVDSINNLEKKINAHLSAFKSHTHLGVKAGTDVSGIAGGLTPDSISPLTKVSDLEDTKIKH